MNKSFIKIGNIIFIIVIVFTIAGCSNNQGLGFSPVNDNTEYSVFSIDGKITDVKIPVKYKGKPVTRINNEGFKDYTALASVIIPDSILNIGRQAFSGCRNLTSVTIPASVEKIGRYAFEGCINMESITIPFVGSSRDSVSDAIFRFIFASSGPNVPSSLKKVTVTSGGNIGESAFYNCGGIESITLNETVTSIGSNAFYGCESLDNFIIPPGVTSIGSGAFNGCSSLTSIVIPDGVTSVANNLFYGCANLASVVIPNSVTSIGNSSFYACGNLTEIIIPNRVTSIGQYAFYLCVSLKSVTIPDSVTAIGSYAFYECGNLTSVTIGANVNFNYQIIGSGFETAYNNNGKTAGTYTRPNTISIIWTKQ